MSTPKVNLGIKSVYEVKKQKYESMKDEYAQEINDQDQEELLEDDFIIPTF